MQAARSEEKSCNEGPKEGYGNNQSCETEGSRWSVISLSSLLYVYKLVAAAFTRLRRSRKA